MLSEMSSKFEIDDRIKSLVDILNQVPYIRTFSSCEAHYELEDIQDHRANVIFHVEKGKESEFEGLAALILKETVNDWNDASVEIFKRYSVEIFKRYFVRPGDEHLDHNYEIIIKPFPRKMSLEEKRQYTDEAIKKVVDTVRKYLSR